MPGSLSNCRSIVVWVCVGVCLALMSLAATADEAKKSFISSPGAAAEAVAKIVEATGRVPRVLSIDIAPERVRLIAQGSDRSWHLEQWRFEIIKLWFLSREQVSGPQVVQAPGPVDDVESGLFKVSDIALGDAARIARAAIERARLEDPATVTSINIARSVSILPRPSYGDIRWTIAVASPYEAATIYTNARGDIVAIDLSGTHRAKMLDLYGGDWPVLDAQRALASVVGTARTVYKVAVDRRSVSVNAASPDDPKKLRGYSWDLSGVRRSLVDMPNIDIMMGRSDQAAFSFDVVDLTIVPGLAAKARDKLAMPKGRITSMEATRPTTQVGGPTLVWEVEVTDTDGSKGIVKADQTGAVTDVILPESRRPPMAWLAPDGIRVTLGRIAKSFGANARFTEISIDDEKASVVAEDPLKRGENAQFIVDATEISRFGFPFDKHVHAETAFTLEEAASIDAGHIKAMEDETLRRMKLPDAHVARVTFSRGNVFVQSPRGLITVEVRLDRADGNSGGRVTFDAEGRVIDVVNP